jgi:hypothetical protein
MLCNLFEDFEITSIGMAFYDESWLEEDTFFSSSCLLAISGVLIIESIYP